MVWQINWSTIEPLFMGDVSEKQRQGIESLLAECDNQSITDSRWVAYILATSYHETNRTMRAVREAYWLSESWRKANFSYYPYYGRGHVQLTHRENYKKAGDAFGFDLVSKPDDALLPEVSAKVIVVGMRDGWFRADSSGKRHTLKRYFSDTMDDAESARKIVNGKEKKVVGGKTTTVGAIMANYHDVFLAALSSGAAAGLASMMKGVAGAAAATPAMAGAAAMPLGGQQVFVQTNAMAAPSFGWGEPEFDSGSLPGEPVVELNDYYPYEMAQAQYETQIASPKKFMAATPAMLAAAGAAGPHDALLNAAHGLGLSVAMERLIEVKSDQFPTSKPRYWAIFNLDSHSARKRLHVFDATDGTVTSHLAAHGRGSDTNHDGMAERFSNKDGSHMTSLGVYRCAETYFGENGLSLRMDGLESTNSNARARAVVIHGANYVSDAFVAMHGVIGRSWGCPAVPHADRNSVISRLRGGSFLIAWKT